MQLYTDRSKLKYMQICSFLLTDGSVVKAIVGDSCIIEGALYGENRKDICWTKVVGYYK